MEDESITSAPAMPAAQPDLSVVAITLLKGVVYQDGDARLWASLVHLQARVRDYVAVLGLELVLDEAEGYAFLKSRPEPEDGDLVVPRLVPRRPLSFPVSLLLALLRKKLAEFDAGGGDTRLVIMRDDIVELMRVFLPDNANEARHVDHIDAHINKVADLGFLRRLKPEGKTSAGAATFEVRRILKAFVDADWLAGLDSKLAAEHARVAGVGAETTGGDNE